MRDAPSIPHSKIFRVAALEFFAKGSLQKGYLEFYFAKQRAGLHPLSLNDKEKPLPPSSSVPPPI